MADIIPKESFYNSNYTGGAIDEAVAQTKANKTDIEGIKTAINNKLDKPSDLDTTYKIVITNNSSTETLGYANASTPSTVMQRDTNGRAQVVDGIDGNDIVNFSQLQTKSGKLYVHNITTRIVNKDTNTNLFLEWKVINDSPISFSSSTEANLDLMPNGKYFDFSANGNFTSISGTLIEANLIFTFSALIMGYRYYNAETQTATYEWEFDNPVYANTQGVVVVDVDNSYYSMVIPTVFTDVVVSL